MKALRIFLSVIVSIILVILVVGLTLTSSLKTIIQKDIFTEAFKTQVLSSSENISTEDIDKLLSDKETNKIVNEVIDDLISDINSEKMTINDTTIDDALKYAESHKEELEKLTGSEINLDDINKEEIKTTINESLAEVNTNMEPSVKGVFEVYGILTSKEFTIGMIAAIAFQIILLILLSWSVYKWLLPAGISLIVAGVIGFAAFLLSYAVVGMLATQINMTINTSSIMYNSFIELGVGIITVIIYSVIKKKTKKEVEA